MKQYQQNILFGKKFIYKVKEIHIFIQSKLFILSTPFLEFENNTLARAYTRTHMHTYAHTHTHTHTYIYIYIYIYIHTSVQTSL